MEVLEASNGIERMLFTKADQTRTPLGGGFELLPFCNMNCNMCYVRNNHLDQWRQVLSAAQWLDIAQRAKEAGTLYVLLTGGEPLLHPEFREIYLGLQSMGFILTVNTNGTLIDEEWAEFFAAYPCRRINVTVYGASNATYERLCHNPQGYDQVMRALKLLREKDVLTRINVTLVKENRDDLEEIAGISRELGIPFVPTTYMFPPERKGCADACFWDSRMSPEEAAESRLKATFLRNPEAVPEEQARALIHNLLEPKAAVVRNKGFSCKASASEYWINWKGEISPCAMIQQPLESLLTKDFMEAWERIGQVCDAQRTCVTCKSCAKKIFCQTCAAACLTETGDFSGRPGYLCQVTDAMLEHVLTYLKTEEERKEYREHLQEIFSDAVSPEVSIVVPVYNVERYLERCLDSILRQSYQSFELILVDDGSTDGSGGICDRYARLDTRVHVAHQVNRGVSAARNVGIRMARAPYLLFCDSDDWVEANWCRLMYEKICANPYSFIQSNVWAGDEEQNKKVVLDIGVEDTENIPIEDNKDIAIYAYVWNKIYNVKILREKGILFDETCSYNEDLYFNDAYIENCDKGIFIKQPLNVYLVHEGSLASSHRAVSEEEEREIVRGLRLKKMGE